MKTRSLLPVAVLEVATPASVDRILARSFWGDEQEQQGEVIELAQRRAEPEQPARTPRNPAAR